MLCGDSTNIDDVEALMCGENASMLFTDIPYNVAFKGRSGNFEVIKNDKLAENEFAELSQRLCRCVNHTRHSRNLSML